MLRRKEQLLHREKQEIRRPKLKKNLLKNMLREMLKWKPTEGIEIRMQLSLSRLPKLACLMS